MSDNLIHRRFVFPVVVACALLIGSGAGFRAYAAYLNQPSDGELKIRPALATIPLTFGPWRGEDIPVDSYVRKATDTDDLVHRRYVREGGNDSLRLYVAFGVRARDLAPHRPEVCYPGAGWSFQRKDAASIALADGTAIPCRVLTFSQGGFDLRRVAVVNFYIVDGVASADMESLRAKVWRGSTAVQSMAQIQISCTTSTLRDIEAARRLAIEFAQECAPSIRDVLTRPAATEATAR